MLFNGFDNSPVLLAGSKVAFLIGAFIVMKVVFTILKGGSRGSSTRYGYIKGGVAPSGFVRADKGTKEWKEGTYVNRNETKKGQERQEIREWNNYMKSDAYKNNDAWVRYSENRQRENRVKV